MIVVDAGCYVEVQHAILYWSSSIPDFVCVSRWKHSSQSCSPLPCSCSYQTRRIIGCGSEAEVSFVESSRQGSRDLAWPESRSVEPNDVISQI
jgi:hypothetical protein